MGLTETCKSKSTKKTGQKKRISNFSINPK